MKFRVLGPLTVTSGGCEASLSAQQRAVMAVLLLRADQAPSSSWLTEAIWGNAQRSATGNVLRMAILRLRDALRSTLGPDAAERVVTAARGYKVSVNSNELDLAEFSAMTTKASVAAREGDLSRAQRALASALRLWPDDPLPDLPDTPLIDQERRCLLDRREAAESDLWDIMLALQRHREIIPDLRARVTENPMREHTWAQLVRALYRDNRRADALATADDAEKALDCEGFGLGPELRHIVAQIARDDPALTSTAVTIDRPEYPASAFRTSPLGPPQPRRQRRQQAGQPSVAAVRLGAAPSRSHRA
jgi:DNA-binding SARP family transcriptional activator